MRTSTLRRPLRAALIVLLATSCRAPAPAASHAPPDPAQSVPAHHSFTLVSRVLAETRSIHLYTPPGYATAPDTRYPLLYVPDGGLDEDLPHLLRSVDAAIRAGDIRPVIVVGIANTERRRDMTGPTQIAADRDIAPRVGGSANFRAFLRDELMPEIARRVRSSGETAIIGESLAGLFIVETFLHAPDMFDAAIAISPSLWWNDRSLVRGATQALQARPHRPSTLFLTHAGDDDDGAIAALAQILRRAAPADLRLVFAPMPAEQHSTIYRAVAPAALRAVFGTPRGAAPP